MGMLNGYVKWVYWVQSFFKGFSLFFLHELKYNLVSMECSDSIFPFSVYTHYFSTDVPDILASSVTWRGADKLVIRVG